MNQDFGLSLTPSIARRLLRFERIFNVKLSDEVFDLAEQNEISIADFDQFVCPHNKTKQVLTQFLLDCNLRGIVQQNYHPEFGEIEVLNAVRLKKPKHISIFTGRSHVWQRCSKAIGIDNNIHYFLHFHMDGEDIDKLRYGVLIIDLDLKTDYNYLNKVRDLGCEFPQTILFSPKEEQPQDLIAWTNLARALFPTMPHPLYARVVQTIPKDWKDMPLSLFATYYNMCLLPELVTDKSIIDLMSDENCSFHNVKIT